MANFIIYLYLSDIGHRAMEYVDMSGINTVPFNAIEFRMINN